MKSICKILISIFIVIFTILAIFHLINYTIQNDKINDVPTQNIKIRDENISKIMPETIENVNLRLYEKHLVDETNLKKKLNVKKEKAFTAFIEIGNFHHIETLSKEFNMDLSVINYDDRMEKSYIMVSFGRKVEGILCHHMKDLGVYSTEVTFAEEYTDHMMYVYLMDRIPLWDPFLEGHTYYIMKDKERVYVGNWIYDLNKNIEIIDEN